MSVDLEMAYIYTTINGHPYSPLYDCSNKTTEEWYETGSKQWALGLYFLSTGIILEVLYLPCLLAMVKMNMLTSSCYKIMFFLGFLDMASVFINSIMTGYLAIKGAVFCTNPILLLSLGAFGCGCWCASCMTCVFLALNRCADLSNNRFLKIIFEGNRVYFLMFITILYLLFITFLTTPASFNSNYASWFFNPMIGIESSRYVNFYHTLNNVIVSVVTTFLYIYLCIKLYLKMKAAVSKLGRFQKQVFIQSFLICIINAVAAYIYVYMQYITAPKWLVIIGQIAWQLSAGSVCIIYLTVNRTIRRRVIELMVPEKWAGRVKEILAPTTRVLNPVSSTPLPLS